MTLTPTDRETIDRIVARLGPASRLLFITGAGMSADSGLPTYRGIGGLYDRRDTDEGVPIEEALSGRMLHARPELCWKYLAQIGRAAMGGRFNRGHEVLAQMERHFAHACVVTQNIDGYHRAAGSRNVIDLHGDMHELLCTECDFQQAVDRDDLDRLTIPPRCPRCGGLVRPDVVLFGEMLPAEKIERLMFELRSGFDAVFSIGTTSVFPYIAEPVRLAADAGWTTVEINPEQTMVSHLVEFRLPARAAVALDAIWKRYGSVGRGQ